MNIDKVSGPNDRYLILLDYDGTLTPIRPRPEQARLSPVTRRLLDRLSKRHRVVLLSGRDVASLRRLAEPGPQVGLVGTHGAECAQLPGLRLMSTSLARRLRFERERLLKALLEEFGGERGLQIEVKTFSLALHYRRACLSLNDEKRIRTRFKKAVRRAIPSRDWGLQLGKKMIDLKPRGFNKRTAVRALRLRYPDLKVFVAGDDWTDLDAFKAAGPKALRIAVGDVLPRTLCDRRFRDVATFLRFLAKGFL